MQDTILLENNTKQVSCHAKERYFITKRALPIQQILTETFKLKDSVDLNYITGWVWVKFVIKNNGTGNRFVLHTSDGHISGLYMYKPTPMGYKMTPPKQYHPEDGREIYNRIPAFFLDIERGETKIYYLKIEVVDEIVNFNYIIQDYPHYTQNAQTDYLIIGLFFGALLLIIIVNLFYFVKRFYFPDICFICIWKLSVYSNIKWLYLVTHSKSGYCLSCLLLLFAVLA